MASRGGNGIALGLRANDGRFNSSVHILRTQKPAVALFSLVLHKLAAAMTHPCQMFSALARSFARRVI